MRRLFGCYDLSSLVLIFIGNATMNFWGLAMEEMNPPSRTRTNWMPFVFGSVAGCVPSLLLLLQRGINSCGILKEEYTRCGAQACSERSASSI